MSAEDPTSHPGEETSLTSTLKYQNLQWPNLADFIQDKDQDIPAKGELLTTWCDRVSDLGYPVSEAGVELAEKLANEVEKRDQDAKGIFIYEDWNGWGISEVMSNLLRDFDGGYFKRSPCEKWEVVEAVACFVNTEDRYVRIWMTNEDGEGIGEIINMIGVMVLSCLSTLAKHELLTPNSEVKNIPIISLLLLDFLHGDAGDLECGWGCEVVRLCDEAGIKLEKHTRKQVGVSEENINEWRYEYMEKKESSEYARDENLEGNGYREFAGWENWTPGDDVDDEGKRLWYRCNWHQEYQSFKEEHPGGNRFDLSKMSKAKVRSCRLG